MLKAITEVVMTILLFILSIIIFSKNKSED